VLFSAFFQPPPQDWTRTQSTANTHSSLDLQAGCSQWEGRMLPNGSEYSSVINIINYYFIEKPSITHRVIKNISPLSGSLRVIGRTLRSECLHELQILLPSDFMAVVIQLLH